MKYRVISPEVISAEVDKPQSKLYLGGSADSPYVWEEHRAMTAHRPRHPKLRNFTSMWPCCFGHHQTSFLIYKLGLSSPELAKKLPGSRPKVNTQSQGSTGFLPLVTGTGSKHLFLEDATS